MHQNSWTLLEVQRRTTVAADIVEFELCHPEGVPLPPFSPGAHLRVQTPSGAERKYSLVNPPSDRERFVIAVKRDAGGRGGSVSMVDDLKEGALLSVGLPDNAFPMAEHAKRFIFIAGGIGITPILCMVRTLLRYEETLEREPVPFKLYYLTRDAANTAYRDEVAALGAKAVLHHDQGDAANTYDLWPVLEKPVAGTHVYCCGPRGLMDAVRDMTGHWSDAAIHFESFGVGDASMFEPNQTFAVKLARSGEVIPVAPQQTVLEALLAHGCRVSSSCEAGSCGSCRTGYLAGDVEHRDLVLGEDEKSHQIMVCVSRARGGELVLDL
jgi:phthalate 4,5-dioxygenase reductase subunit